MRSLRAMASAGGSGPCSARAAAGATRSASGSAQRALRPTISSQTCSGSTTRGVGAVAHQEQRVVAAEPALQRAEAAALAARLDLSLQRLGAADVEVDVGAVAAVPEGAGERHTLGADAAFAWISTMARSRRRPLSREALPMAGLTPPA